MSGDGTIDRERLQAALDDIADMVEWGSGWIGISRRRWSGSGRATAPS
ncbi:MAG: hypothetical protein U0838_00640 [Chloroflexota bacterium]